MKDYQLYLENIINALSRAGILVLMSPYGNRLTAWVSS